MQEGARHDVGDKERVCRRRDWRPLPRVSIPERTANKLAVALSQSERGIRNKTYYAKPKPDGMYQSPYGIRNFDIDPDAAESPVSIPERTVSKLTVTLSQAKAG